VGFAPLQAVSLLSKVSTVAFSRLGCWSADCTLTLDTNISILHLVKCGLRNCWNVDRRDGYLLALHGLFQ